MPKLFRVAAAFFIVLFGATSANAESWTVTSEENYPPYNFNQDGKRTGMDVEIVEAVLARIDVTPEHRAVPWNRVVNDLDQNQTDIGFQFVGKPERFEKYNMAGPHRAGVTVFAVRADSSIAFDRLEDLTGKKVGIVSGFAYTTDFDQAGFIVKEAATDNLLNLRKLMAGRIDAAIGDLHTLAWLVKQEKIGDKVRFLPRPLAEVPRYIAFPKPRIEQANRFGKALDELKADGTIQSIVAKWQAVD
ncbi:MAG TPA: transporter substrate-binding domain-containing protein [Azospirillaceae bacterium]|nr:transporter substrate-binding domain-containing protein [Azospirillaceae bacterium]